MPIVALKCYGSKDTGRQLEWARVEVRGTKVSLVRYTYIQ